MEEEKPLNQSITHTSNWLVLTALVPIVGLVTGLVLLLKRPNSRPRLGLLTILSSIIIGVVYGYTYHHLSPLKDPYAYHYSQLVETRVTAGKPGTTATLKRPAEFKASRLTSDSGGIYSHQVQLDGKPVAIGLLSASDSPLLNPQLGDKPLITALNQGPSAAQYASIVKPIQAYVRNQLSGWNKITLDRARPLKTHNIIQKAWYFEFTGSPVNQTDPAIKGEAIFILGKNAIYLFVLETAEHNWTTNTQLLGQVVDSIKIDQ
ncbi:MAG TPA: hypothetical protein VFP35_01475 [Candidatus Saccharimonadales bacterium]|nr:hypothetical protein [Candidatus Saccharimonadales bacterium]